MKKAYLLLILVVCIFLGFKTTNNTEAIKVIKAYKTSLFNIPDYKVYNSSVNDSKDPFIYINNIQSIFKPYFTEEGFKGFIGNRVPIMYRQIGWYGKFNMKLEGISIKKTYIDNKGNKLTFDYIETIKIYNSKIVKYLKQEGQITIERLNGKWKIKNDTVILNSELKKILNTVL